MTRWIAVLLLLVFAVALVAPAVVPATAYAAVGDPGTAALPPIPWGAVWNLVKAWGPMIIYLLDALWNAINGGVDPSGSPNPPPPPPPPGDPSVITPTRDRTAPVAWCGAALAAAGARA